MKHSPVLLIAPAAIALAIAGCGGASSGGSSGATAASTATPAASPAPKAAVVDVRSTGLGRILVDGQGRTLYLFEKDKGPKSSCAGECASDWPPLITTSRATAAKGATSRLLGTAKRPGGALQATYAGHPLYLYEGDSRPSQTTGEGLEAFGAEWYVLGPSGKKVEEAGS
jgi:predicted lipoprotein with Yx(FWY)xxD motif